MTDLIPLASSILVLIFSVVIHEIAHGFMALKLGDETAKREGRLTLNPIVHIDPVGSILLPLLSYLSGGFLIGWAKPVPFNPLALHKDYKYGPLKVAIAGPLSNLGLAFAIAMVIRFFGEFLAVGSIEFLISIVVLNSFLFVFNMIPIPPLDGSKILTLLLPEEYARRVEMIGFSGLIFILLFLTLFSKVFSYAALFVAGILIGPLVHL